MYILCHYKKSIIDGTETSDNGVVNKNTAKKYCCKRN